MIFFNLMWNTKLIMKSLLLASFISFIAIVNSKKINLEVAQCYINYNAVRLFSYPNGTWSGYAELQYQFPQYDVPIKYYKYIINKNWEIGHLEPSTNYFEEFNFFNEFYHKTIERSQMIYHTQPRCFINPKNHKEYILIFNEFIMTSFTKLYRTYPRFD